MGVGWRGFGRGAVAAKLEKLVRLNKTRADFAEKFEALIESYNNGSRNIEQIFEELLKLSNSLDDEQERHVREYLTEEELVIFDILTRPAPAERDVPAHKRRAPRSNFSDGAKDESNLFFDEARVPVKVMELANPEIEGLAPDQYEVGPAIFRKPA